MNKLKNISYNHLDKKTNTLLDENFFIKVMGGLFLCILIISITFIIIGKTKYEKRTYLLQNSILTKIQNKGLQSEILAKNTAKLMMEYSPYNVLTNYKEIGKYIMANSPAQNFILNTINSGTLQENTNKLFEIHKVESIKNQHIITGTQSIIKSDEIKKYLYQIKIETIYKKNANQYSYLINKIALKKNEIK